MRSDVSVGRLSSRVNGRVMFSRKVSEREHESDQVLSQPGNFYLFSDTRRHVKTPKHGTRPWRLATIQDEESVGFAQT